MAFPSCPLPVLQVETKFTKGVPRGGFPPPPPVALLPPPGSLKGLQPGYIPLPCQAKAFSVEGGRRGT